MIFLKRRALMTRASFNYKTVNGIGSAVLENCVETRFKRLSLSGNSKQTSTKGINLIPFNVGEKIESSNKANSAVFGKDGVNVTVNIINPVKENDLYFFGNDNISVESGYSDTLLAGDYTFLSNSKLCNFWVVVWRNGTTEIIVENSDKLITHFTVLDGDKVRLFLRPKGNANSKGTEKTQVMLCKHTETNLPYEPYTGRKPSPSVEYPQEIVSAGKYDKTSGKYLFDVNVTGKNIINEEHFFDLRNWTKNLYPVQLVPDTKYTFSRRDNSGYKSGMFLQIKRTVEGAFSQIINTNSELSCKQKVTFTTNETGLIEFQIQNVNNINFKDMLGYAQLEKSDVPTPYEPYREPQITQLQLDEPLRGICENKDVVTKDSIIRKVKEIIFDENAEFIIDTGEIQIKTTAFISPVISDATPINLKQCRMMCDRFKVLISGFDTLDEECCVLYNKRFIFRLNKERADTVEKLKEWLKQNPIKVQYLLQEPILEPFENNLGNLHANDGTTIITVDSGEVETGIEVEYAVKE